MTNLPEMTLSAEERHATIHVNASERCMRENGYQNKYVMHEPLIKEGVIAIEQAFRDGALAERERIMVMLQGPEIEGLAAVALCKRQNTKQCAAICLSHSSLIELGACPEIGTVWLQNALAVLRALADRIAAEGKDDNG